MIPSGLVGKSRKNIPLPMVIGGGIVALAVLLFGVVALMSMGAPAQTETTVQVPLN